MSGWASRQARAAATLTSTLVLPVACSALFGSEFDGYGSREGVTGGAGTGGRAASGGGKSGGSGGRTPPVESGGTGSGASSGGDASVDQETRGSTDHFVPDENHRDRSEPEAGGSGGDTGRTPITGGFGGSTGGTPQGGAGGSGGGPQGGSGGAGGSPAICVAPSNAPASRPRPPYGTTWPRTPVPEQIAPILICYTTAPHVEWNNTPACAAQTSAALSCSGEPITGTTATPVADLRLAFETLLQDTWARATNLEFYSFECPTTAGHVDTSRVNPIPLQVTFTTKDVDAEPLTDAVTGIGKHGAVDAFRSDLHVDWKGLLSRDPDALRTILRETGQVLGLRYEWFRDTTFAKAPNACPGDLMPQSAPSWTPPLYSFYDFYSVTDRCTPTCATRPGLSPGDVVGAQKLYGTKPIGALLSYRAGCAGSDNPSDGAPVLSFPCRRTDTQKWSRPSSATWPAFEDTVSGQHRCMSVSGNAVSSGFTPVLSKPCDQSTGQRFELNNVEWRGEGNMCVTLTGTEVTLDFCDGSKAQQWNFFDVNPSTEPTWDMIQSAQTGECVTMPRDPSVDQTPPVPPAGDALLAPCSATNPRQHFVYLDGGFIQYGSLCLDVLGGEPVPGEHIGLWSGCGSPVTFNSQFFISGQIKALGQCLSMRPKAGFIGEVGVEPCAPGNHDQFWEFHF